MHYSAEDLVKTRQDSCPPMERSLNPEKTQQPVSMVAGHKFTLNNTESET